MRFRLDTSRHHCCHVACVPADLEVALPISSTLPTIIHEAVRVSASVSKANGRGERFYGRESLPTNLTDSPCFSVSSYIAWKRTENNG
mmetsp:Transcript_8139/g.24509  ORF Transcript_8139/g.24509 Transcript_8139/m.24509 type:complete len:88 (-) Transcript_8139:10-273(-)